MALATGSGGGSSLSSDLGHVFAVLGNTLASFSPDLGHVLAVAGDGKPSFAGHFFAGIGVHRGCAA
jgi:hypothetical protein